MSSTQERGRWTHTFRQSWLGTLQMCPEQARASYFDELPEREHTDSTALGTAVHAGIEAALRDELDVDDAVHAALLELQDLTWTQTKYDEGKVYELVQQAVRAWDRDIRALVKPAQVEHTFEVPLYRDAHRTINLSGTWDCADQEYVLWDWKTAARKYDAWEKQRWAVQPTVYTYAIWYLNDQLRDEHVMPETRFNYAVMVHDGSTQIIPIRRDHSHVSWLREQCIAAALMIESGATVWPLNDAGWWCNEQWCPKWADCKGAHMNDGWTVTEKWLAA